MIRRTGMSRREFVTVIAAGAGLAAAAPALAEKRRRRRSSGGTKPTASTAPATSGSSASTDAAQAEFERQREGMRSLVKLVRETSLPPGGDLALVFQPLRVTRKGR